MHSRIFTGLRLINGRMEPTEQAWARPILLLLHPKARAGGGGCRSTKVIFEAAGARRGEANVRTPRRVVNTRRPGAAHTY